MVRRGKLCGRWSMRRNGQFRQIDRCEMSLPLRAVVVVVHIGCLSFVCRRRPFIVILVR